MTKVQADTTQKLERARADATGANTAADGLRKRVQQLLAAGGARCNPGTAPSCTPGANPGKSARRLARPSVKRNRQLAAVADSAIARGKACEAAYDSLTK